jgi:hypothetical protein
MSLSSLHRTLTAAGCGLERLPPEALEPLPVKGVAHAHYRLGGTGLLARVPGWSQIGLDPATALGHQAACFERAAGCGHTPRLRAVLPPTAAVPLGALVVEEIAGRPPRLPAELPALAQALAALHRLPVPAVSAPLAAPAAPVAALRALIGRQWDFLAQAGLAPAALRALEQERTRAQTELEGRTALPQPPTLIGTDTHPGNFLIDSRGKAWFVDLEKAQYGLPAMDLAHTTLYTSTTWDADCAAVLDSAAVAGFYRAWAEAVPAALAQAARPWLAPVRRLVWLRSLTWMARWRVESEAAFGPALPPSLRRHIRARVADFLAPETIERVRSGLTLDPAADWPLPNPRKHDGHGLAP